MKDLFTLDIKNYLPQWNKEKRDSSRGIIMAKGKKVLPFSPDDKILLVFAKNQGYYKFPGGGIHADEVKHTLFIVPFPCEVLKSYTNLILPSDCTPLSVTL